MRATAKRKEDDGVERITLAPGVHYLHGMVNCGLIETDSGFLIVDTGLDSGAAKKLLRAAEELGRPLVAILNTHAHADHHGGNAHLVRKLGIPVYAPAAEAAVIREPRYEPMYLFGGASPPSVLVSKFLQAEPSPVDHVFTPGEPLTIDGRALETLHLPGHSVSQCGVRAGSILFAADAFFGREGLRKHGVPYLVHAGQMRASLLAVRNVTADWFIPGHGPALDDPEPTLQANLDVLDRALAWVGERVERAPVATEELLVEFAARFALKLDEPGAFVLNRAALLGFLTTLHGEGDAEILLEGGRWHWTGGGGR